MGEACWNFSLLEDEVFFVVGVAGDAVGGDEEELGGETLEGVAEVGGDLFANACEYGRVGGGKGQEEVARGNGGEERGAEMFAELAVEFGEKDAGGIVPVGVSREVGGRVSTQAEHGEAVALLALHGMFVGIDDKVLEGLVVKFLEGDVPAFEVVEGDGAFAGMEKLGGILGFEVGGGAGVAWCRVGGRHWGGWRRRVRRRGGGAFGVEDVSDGKAVNPGLVNEA